MTPAGESSSPSVWKPKTASSGLWPRDRISASIRVCRVRDWTRAGFENMREIVDFNRGVAAPPWRHEASVVAVEGFSDDQAGMSRTCRVYTLPKPKELWRGSSSPKWGGGSGMLTLDPEGNFMFWVEIADSTAWVRPRVVHLKTGKEDDRDFDIACLAPGGNFTLTRDLDPVNHWPRGISLHRGSSKAPLATFASDFSVAHATQFSRQGSHFAWGTIDGTVILCDIAATQAKLAEARPGVVNALILF